MEYLSSKRGANWLVWFYRSILIVGLTILLARLVSLQVIEGNYYKSLAEGNRVREIVIEAPRGKIMARGGEALANNRSVEKRIVFDPESGYTKTTDISDAAQQEIITEPKRYYTYGSSVAHITGYLGEVDQEEVGKVDAGCRQKGARKLGSLVGRSGLEQEYNCTLQGIDGEELVEVDSNGERVRTLGSRPPVPGEDITTTIDINLQERIEQLMADKRGGVIVTDIQGEVLALYSSPSFDPNSFLLDDEQVVDRYLSDNKLPLFNRVIGGQYHPGSVVKPVVATAALEEGVIDENFTYEDKGSITIDTAYGEFTYNNWYFTQYGSTEGKIDVTRAIARSTDTFFYTIGELLGIEKIVGWMNKFGLGGKTNIDIPGEVAGFVPSPAWKKRVKGERWFLGNTYHISIGQGDLAVNIAGINRAISAIASGGKLCNFYLVSGYNAKASQDCRDLKVDSGNLNLVRDGMIGACSPGGTAFPFFDAPTPVACKTGTAETNDEDKTHAWLAFFAPVDFPEIVVTVMVEEGGEGSDVAGPIARDIYNYWFKLESEEDVQGEGQ
ncbi:MAG: penicillin-binding transpeptidase domain-containing protein [Candidatus Woesebacteria bacterium]|jgi:penicillin-binding protein 2